ncbi:MAG: hypothetical protein J6T08_08850 [Lentisphaeria bacterium]|nr:hypothetical protein [Lentisphaeria bacterium]
MSNEKFTPGEWYLGNPFRHKDSKSEWRNVYADGEKNPIAVVLLNDGFGKTYNNATLLQVANEMYECICDALSDLEMPDGMRNHFEEVLKKARGEG